MTNEVINNTEELNQNETSVAEETNTENSVENVPETPVSPENQPTAPEAGQNPGEMDFGAILEEFEQDQIAYHSGDLVEGKVVGISDRGVLVDFGFKSEGIVPVEEFTTPEGVVSVQRGDNIEAVIRTIYGDAPPVLSRNDAVNRKSWDKIEKAFNEEQPIIGLVTGKTKGGLKVEIEGVEAFLPGSQVDSRPIRNLDSFKDQEIEAKVIKFSRKRNNIVLSRKVLTDEVENARKAETLGQIEEGYVVEGTIRNLTEYGAFVDIGGIDGLLHVTDMSWGRLQNPHDQFKVNDHIQIKILKLDRAGEKVSLGYKQLIPDPWSTVIEVYPVGSKITGRVSSLTDYGAFIELEPGVEGLVHVSEMSWSKRSLNPKRLLKNGEDVEVQVLGVDTDERRISLGMKQLQENPWHTITDRYQVGSTIRGRVRNLTDFGAFVEVEEGVDGLVHISDISHSKKIKHPKDVLKKDQEVEAVITSIDIEGHRISLSIKDTTPSEWDNFVASHKPGDIVRGKVSRFAGFGVFVELGSGLEGLCHISELADERVEKPEDVVSLGQELDFKILRIEEDDQKIGLSHRAVGKESEPIVDTKNYSSEAKSGMASLGELMNLKRGIAAEEPAEDEPKLSKKERKALKRAERAENESQTDVEQTSETAETSAENEEAGNAAEPSEDKPVDSSDTPSEIIPPVEEVEEAEEAAKTAAADETVADNQTDSTEVSAETAAAESASVDVAEKTEPAGETENSESAAAEKAGDETPLLTDIEGEAVIAPENSAPNDEIAAAEPETASEIVETVESKEAEEKKANG